MPLKLFCKIITLVLLAVFGACRPKFSVSPFKTVIVDFDQESTRKIDSINKKPVFEKAKGYKGDYAGRTSNATQFGYIYKFRLGDISDKHIKWIKCCSMLKKLSGSVNTSCAVCEIKDAKGKRLEWLTVPLRFKLIEREVWTEVEFNFDISHANDPENSIAISIWNLGSGEEVLQDELEIKFYD